MKNLFKVLLILMFLVCSCSGPLNSSANGPDPRPFSVVSAEELNPVDPLEAEKEKVWGYFTEIEKFLKSGLAFDDPQWLVDEIAKILDGYGYKPEQYRIMYIPLFSTDYSINVIVKVFIVDTYGKWVAEYPMEILIDRQLDMKK